jgi:hypothetical protein
MLAQGGLQSDPREAQWCLFQEQAGLVIGDPTEIERWQAWRAEYVGKLKDGKTRGFWARCYVRPLICYTCQ